MDQVVDKIIGCTNDTQDLLDYENELILINTPAVEKSLVYTDAKINDSYYRDINNLDSVISFHIELDENNKEIKYLIDSEGNRYPSVVFTEFTNLEDSVVVKLENGDLIRLLKVNFYNDDIELPDVVFDSIVDNCLTVIRSTWLSFED